jgi:site-specific recombinase XerD
MGAQQIAAFLTWLATDRGVSASTQNQALSAVLFLYRDVLHIEIGRIENVPRARMPVRVPVVLSRDEVIRIMKHVDGVAWIVVALLYGAGLRLQECLELRVKEYRSRATADRDSARKGSEGSSDGSPNGGHGAAFTAPRGRQTATSG